VLGETGNYGKDDNNVYWIIEGEEGPEPHAVIGADPNTFMVLPDNEFCAKDAERRMNAYATTAIGASSNRNNFSQRPA
jgi:hypothetical protein